MTTPLSEGPIWPVWRKIGFRFAFIYLLFYVAPWSLVANALGSIEVEWIQILFTPFYKVVEYYGVGWNWIVALFNTHVYTVAPELVPFNGSGDTSFGWAQLVFMLCFAAVGTIAWSVLDGKRNNYERLDYWLRLSVRYYISFYCLLYGIIKIFTLQMIFPNLSQLATPLGDFLPMRFSWLFIGYSTPYQVFSGVMETIAGLLLINRKTVTLGLITATGVFIHVFVLNLAYDIPVKLFSGHLLLFCIYLLSYEMNRLINFFILNRVSEPDTSFNVEFRKKWMRWTRIGLKSMFVLTAFILPMFSTYSQYGQVYNPVNELKPIRKGMYDVDLYVRNNKDTVPAIVTDSTRWKNIIFENGTGSVDAEPSFFKRYNRYYFSYKPDTINNLIKFKPSRDTTTVFTMRYEVIDDNTVNLRTFYKGDSLYMRLKRNKHHFQLTERQFHWLSEANR